MSLSNEHESIGRAKHLHGS